MKDRSIHKWWQTGAIYQIYPRSFKDSNGDGIGDLQGIIQKLDYLHWLGIKAIWISPIYPSPMADFGYDIADYTNIHPLFGSLQDFDQLVEAIHQRDMKLILDLVPNHTSDEHPWFQESRSSKDNPKRNWYIWKDPKPDGAPPNNWLSNFGGPAWTFDEHTGQYYYHAFLNKQPDLNYRNPEVKLALFDVMKFWLDKGVDGFRIDVIWHMFKDQQWRDNPVNPHYQNHMRPYHQLQEVYSTDQPEIHDLIREMRELTNRYHDRLLIGEIYLPLKKLMQYYGKNGEGLHLPYNFQLVLANWEPKQLFALVNEYEGLLPENAWPNWVLSNHDNPRIATRIGKNRARLAAVLLLTLRGTPTIYYGDELGLEDLEIPSEMIQDPQGINLPGHSRDPQRTPMQWDDSINAGFSNHQPWLPVSNDFEQLNVEKQKEIPDSFLHLHRKLLYLRTLEPALSFGGYRALDIKNDMMVFERFTDKEEMLVIINWSSTAQKINVKSDYQILFSTIDQEDRNEIKTSMLIDSEQALILKKR